MKRIPAGFVVGRKLGWADRWRFGFGGSPHLACRAGLSHAKAITLPSFLNQHLGWHGRVVSTVGESQAARPFSLMPA